MTSSSTEDPYSEVPLDLSGGCFRLVKLQPCGPTDLLKCHLSTHPLPPDCPSYIALSYMWDHESPKDTIELNGSLVEVGHSLWTFLHQMRLNKMFGTYWIDALCINQADVRERNHQVQLMGSIYSQADSVSIWLGVATDEDQRKEAMISIEDLKDAADWERLVHDWTRSQVRAVHDLHCDKYWSRMWIVQEIALAKTATIYCGSYDFTYSFYRKLLRKTDYRSNGRSLDGLLPAQSLENLVVWAQSSQISHLITALQNCDTRKATNAHDKVYALLGLVEEEAALRIPIDYTITIRELWRQVFSYTCQTIEYSNDVDYLRYCGQRIAGGISPRLESEISQQEINDIIQKEFLARSPSAETRAPLVLPDKPHKPAAYFGRSRPVRTMGWINQEEICVRRYSDDW